MDKEQNTEPQTTSISDNKSLRTKLIVGIALALLVGLTAGYFGQQLMTDDSVTEADTQASEASEENRSELDRSVIRAQITQTDVCSAPDVDMFATLLTADDLVYTESTVDDFVVRVDREVVDGASVTKVSDSDLPLNTVLVLDTSGSMNGDKLNNLKFAAQTYIQNRESDDQTAVITFSDSVEQRLDFSTDEQRLKQTVEDIRASGATKLYDGINSGIATAPECGRKAIILMSDGRDTDSSETADEVIATANQQNTPIFVVGIDMDERIGSRLADETGGQYFDVNNPGELPEVYQQIDDQLSGQFVFGLDLGDSVDSGQNHSIELIVGQGQYRAYGAGSFSF